MITAWFEQFWGVVLGDFMLAGIFILMVIIIAGFAGWLASKIT